MKPRPRNDNERMSDSEFFELCGLEWPADIEEIDFSVPGDPGADLYLPGVEPDPVPGGEIQNPQELGRAAANLTRSATPDRKRARDLVAAHRRAGIEPSVDLLGAAGLLAGPAADLEHDDVSLARIGTGEEEYGVEVDASRAAGGEDSYDFSNPVALDGLGDEALLPLLNADAEPVDLARKLWRKKILPIGKIRHGTRVLNFTKDVLENIKRQSLRAFHQVPANLATPDNKHNEDPERFAGEVKDFIVTDSGLDAVLEMNDRGNAVLAANPRLGTSPRFIPNFVRQADNAPFGAIVRHVCLTQDPHIPDDGTWVPLSEEASPGEAQAASLSASGAAQGAVDLTRAAWIVGEQAEGRAGDPPRPEKGGGSELAPGRTDLSSSIVNDPTPKEVTRTVDERERQRREALEQVDFTQLTGDQIRDVILQYQAERDEAVDAASENENRLASLEYSNREKDVNRQLADFHRQGIPKVVLQKAKAFYMEEGAEGDINVVDFTADASGTPQQSERTTNRAALMSEILTDLVAAGGLIDMTSAAPHMPGERGSARPHGAGPGGNNSLRERHESDYEEILGRIGQAQQRHPASLDDAAATAGHTV